MTYDLIMTVIHRLIYISLCSVILLWPSFSQANMALSDYRIFFSANQRSNALQIRNTSDKPLRFTTQIVHMNMTDEGTLIPITIEEAGDSSAKRMLRFSPKRATIPPYGIQAIRFSVRKPKGLKPGEYRAVLKLIGSVDVNNTGGLAVRPKIAYNLPIIIRHGQVNATGELYEPSLIYRDAKPFLSVWLKSDGNRSLYGSLSVLDSGNDEVGRVNGIAFYQPLDKRRVLIPLNDDTTGNVIIKFEEDPAFGGTVEDIINYKIE